MSRKPVPCSVCGKPCNVGKGSRLQPTCHDCRRAQRAEPVACTGGCGRNSAERYRSARDRGKPWTCIDCIRKRPGYRGKPTPAQAFEMACVICGKITLVKWKSYKTCGSEDCGRKVRTARKRRYVDQTPDALIKGECRIWHVNCTECGELFIGRCATAKVCGDTCRRRYKSRTAGDAIKRRYREDPEFRDLVISQAQNRNARKLGLVEITTPVALTDYLMKRDHGRCGICRKPIRAKTGPRRPSIDHIVPLSRGGEHELANLQAAHYDCNLSKNSRGSGEQLLLVG